MSCTSEQVFFVSSSDVSRSCVESNLWRMWMVRLYLLSLAVSAAIDRLASTGRNGGGSSRYARFEISRWVESSRHPHACMRCVSHM